MDNGKWKILLCVLCAMLTIGCAKKNSDKMNLTEGLEIEGRGIDQAAALWTEADGTKEDFQALVREHYCQTDSERVALFESLSRVLERCYESADLLTVELLKPTQLTNADEPATPDWIMSGYSPLAHFSDDMFANKLAWPPSQ